MSVIILAGLPATTKPAPITTLLSIDITGNII